MRLRTLMSLSVLAGSVAGCGTASQVTESSSRSIARIKAQCGRYVGCTVAIVDRGESWVVTTHVPPQSPYGIGWDGDVYTVSKRYDRITQALATE